MPAGVWSKKRERQYKRIVKSCKARGRPAKVCKRVAAATVNKFRADSGESKTWGCHCPRRTVPLRGEPYLCYDRHRRRRVRKTCPV